jgi:hypothetical protein
MKVKRAFIMIKLSAIIGAGWSGRIALIGCSAGITMRGKEETNLGTFRVGSPGGDVELPASG